MKIIFCNVGWMESYRGLSANDQIVGGGSYVNEKGMGHEVCNFYDHRGFVYGYVQPPRAKGEPGAGQINIDRLGGEGRDAVSGVLVVWTATRPEGGTVVVGWYKDAVVHRYYQKFGKRPELHRQNKLFGYRIKARRSNATLLPVDLRTCVIPRQTKGGMGQSNVWFADAPESKPIIKKVLALVAGKPARPRRAQPRTTDPNHKAKVEKIAISSVRQHYEKIGYIVESVEKDNVGWDLEASAGTVTLCIEVKGLSGAYAVAQLSPNEYEAFARCSASYRLAVVTKALVSPSLTICRYSREHKRWIVDGRESCAIDIRPRMSATVQAHI